MKLKRFSVENYKVFKKEFTVEFIKDGKDNHCLQNSFNILTGKNNMGKSTFLEAISEFFKSSSLSNKISNECFNNSNKNIVFKAEFILNENDDILKYLNESYFEEEQSTFNITIVKEYRLEKKPEYYILNFKKELTKTQIKEIAKLINNKEPYYIRPHMTTEEIDKIISNIYTDAITSTEYAKEDLNNVNKEVKSFIQKLKKETDDALSTIEKNVSETLNMLFADQNLKIKISGGDPNGFSVKDLLKNTDTKITVSSNQNNEMLLSEQGTGVQRMSLIYTIQNIIGDKVGNLGNRMLLVDEPEAFLHPEATRGLSNSLYEIGNKMPIIITTHSPILINLEQNHTVIDIFKIDNSNSNAIILYNSKSNKFDENDLQNMKILNYVDPYVNEFFFSTKNIIVEGDTEKMILGYIRKRFNANFHIINARGKSTIQTIMKILNQFDSEYYVLHDLDNVNINSSELKKQRTNCYNILKLKSDDSKIFAIKHTFEAAFYGKTLSNNHKTEALFKILYEENNHDDPIRKTILSTFNKIFSLGIDELSFNEEFISKNVLNIQKQEDIDSQFNID